MVRFSFFLFSSLLLLSDGFSLSKDALKKKFPEHSYYHKLGPFLQKKARSIPATKRSSLLKSAHTQQNEKLETLVIIPKTPMDIPKCIQEIQNLGGRVLARSKKSMRVRVSQNKLTELANIQEIARIQRPFPRTQHQVGFGTVIPSSDTLTGAATLHQAGIKGSGIKIAVIDFGFIGLNNAINAGELPASTIQIDLTGEGMESETDHGAVVSEFAVDMAPEAQLYAIKVNDLTSFQLAGDTLEALDIPIANFSGGWFLQSYYDNTGDINDVINENRDDGVLWIASAGNAAEQHWGGAWADNNNNNWLDFSSGVERLSFETADGIFLNWNQYPSATTDLDLFIYDKDNNIVDSSTNIHVGNNSWPIEVSEITYDTNQAPYQVAIRHSGGSTNNLDLTVFLNKGNYTSGFISSRSLVDPANATGTFTVGAVRYNHWTQSSPAIEFFSSQGPTNDGRIKPDLVGPDGDRSFLKGHVFGTSFSSPVVAGAAALLLQMDSTLDVNGLDSALSHGARDLGTPGKDNVFGFGQLVLPTSPSSSPDNTDLPIKNSTSHFTGSFPHSFRNHLSVPVHLTTHEQIKIDLFSSDGTLKKAVENNVLPPGKHTYSFGSSYDPGVYILQIQVGNQKSVHRILKVP